MGVILNDFIVLNKIGLYCSYGNFYLDPQQPVPYAVVSHAHADHAVSGNTHVYCTKATSAFMQHRYKKNAAGQFHCSDYGHSFYINDIKITFYPAGHMLGSALILMEYKDVRYLYTGDYRLTPDRTCESIQLVKADVLITETTFADPETRHPDVAEEIKKLEHTKSNVMLGAYALGKSQRLIPLINEHCKTKTILVHHSIIPFCRIYEELGISLGVYQVYDRKLMKQNMGNMIYMVPPMVYNSYIKAINVVRVFASGWQHLQRQNEIQLLISDHVDWQDILQTIAEVEPKQVWTLHGEGKHLQAHFKDQIEVKILN